MMGKLTSSKIDTFGLDMFLLRDNLIIKLVYQHNKKEMKNKALLMCSYWILTVMKTADIYIVVNLKTNK